MRSAIPASHSVARQISAEFTALWVWWIHELREVWHWLVERIAPDRARRFVVELTDGAGVVRSMGMTKDAGPRHFTLAPDGGLPELSQIWQQDAPLNARAVLILPGSSVLTCQLSLPPVHDRNISGIIDLQLERELPISRDHLYIDWEIQEKRADRSSIVSVAIARRAQIDKLCDAVRSWGWNILGIGVNESNGQPRFNLLPAHSGRLKLTLERRDWYLIGGAFVLCAAYLVTCAAQWGYERYSLAEPLDIALAQVMNLQKRRAELAAGSKPIASLREMMEPRSVPQVLAELSAVVPADTWIYQLEIRTPATQTPHIKFEAYTPAASVLINLLERSAQLENVQLVESATADVATSTQRVELTARTASVVEQ